MTDFDEHAKNWDDDPEKQERARMVAQAIRAAIPLRRDMRALEYGCGTGLLSFALQPEFDSITLADTSRGMIEVLSGKIEAGGVKNMLPVLLEPTFDPLAEKTFDIVYSLMALHHVPDANALLQCFHKMLVPGGCLAIADLDQEDGSFHGSDEIDVHHGFDRAVLQKQVECAEFSDVTFSTAFTMRKNEREFPVFFMVARREMM
jgi:2-polyprenyl-3-methyl-5-hydroxy-6-metoxy-1,4-benzoquinol methylase